MEFSECPVEKSFDTLGPTTYAKAARLKYLNEEHSHADDNVMKSLAATSLFQCVAIHEGALIPFNYYGRTVVARVEQVRSQDDDDDVSAATTPHGDVGDLTTKFKGTVNLHKRGSPSQMAGHPFPLLLGQPSTALLSTAKAGGPPSVEIGWATKTIIFEDVRGHLMTSFFTCKFFGKYVVQ